MFNEQINRAITQTELDTVFFQMFNQTSIPSFVTAEQGDLFKVINTTHSAYIQEVYGGTGLWSKTGETEQVSKSVPKVTNKMTTYIADFADSVEISKNLFDDNMHGTYQKMVQDFALMGQTTRDANAFNVFNKAFTTSLTADGAAAIATHTLISGGTYSNLVTGALSTTTLNTAITKMATMKNQAGVVIGCTPSILLVPPALYMLASQIVGSPLQQGTPNNDINVFKMSYMIKVYTSPRLSADAGGSDTAWFLIGSNHSVMRYVRQGVETALRGWEFSDNRTYLYQANFREEVAIIDYIGLVGSTG